MILVDEPFEWTPNTFWSHMTSDMNEEELHQFARRIGLKRQWSQVSSSGCIHYDLKGQRMHDRALKAGAQLVSSSELVTRSIRVKKGS